jgi:hypothetical protein
VKKEGFVFILFIAIDLMDYFTVFMVMIASRATMVRSVAVRRRPS